MKTAAEARAAIAANKLAVVLGLEMDELSAREILDLKANSGVALVIPVHMVNNSFGGTAAYDRFFNAANYAMNGKLLSIEHDPGLAGCYDADTRLPCRPFRQGLPDMPFIRDLIQGEEGYLLQYATTPIGHRNTVGLLDE